MRVVRYFYYQLYSYYSQDPAPLFKVFSAAFVGLFLNFLTLTSLVSILLKTHFIFFVTEKGIGRLWPLLFIIPLFLIVRFYMKRRGCHTRIMKEFKDQSTQQNRNGRIAVITNFVGSFALFFLSLWLRESMMNF